MDREGTQAFLWSDGTDFAIAWAAEGQTLVRGPKARGDRLEVQAYRKAVERWRSEGHDAISCYEAASQLLPLDKVAALLTTEQVSWEPFQVWKYYGIGAESGSADKTLFSLLDVYPRSSVHMMKLYRALKKELTPQAWAEMRLLLPGDVEERLGKDAQFRRVARPVLLAGCALTLLGTMAAVFMLVRYVLQ